MMKKKFRPWWIFVFLLMLVACNRQPVETSITIPTDTVTSNPSNPAVSVFGPDTFSLDLPDGWDVFGPLTVENGSGKSYEVYFLGENPSQEGGPGISRVVIADAAQWTPEEFALSQCSTCDPNIYEPVTLAGKSALRTQIGGGGVPLMITWYFVEHKGNLIALAIHDPQTLEPLEEVIESIQFE